jgi:hypothetical protein
MKVEPEEKVRDEHDGRRGWRRTIIGGRWRAVIISWRRTSHIAGRWRRGRGNPIGERAVLNLAELIRSPGYGGDQKQSECGKQANDELFHG